MSKYSDLDFFFKKDNTSGDVSLKKDIQVISQSVKNILLTDANERFFLPNFGADIASEIYTNNADWRVMEILKENIKAKLNLYETRIEIDSINIDYTDDFSLSVDVTFYLVDEPTTLSTVKIETSIANQ